MGNFGKDLKQAVFGNMQVYIHKIYVHPIKMFLHNSVLNVIQSTVNKNT